MPPTDCYPLTLPFDIPAARLQLKASLGEIGRFDVVQLDCCRAVMVIMFSHKLISLKSCL